MPCVWRRRQPARPPGPAPAPRAAAEPHRGPFRDRPGGLVARERLRKTARSQPGRPRGDHDRRRPVAAACGLAARRPGLAAGAGSTGPADRVRGRPSRASAAVTRWPARRRSCWAAAASRPTARRSWRRSGSPAMWSWPTGPATSSSASGPASATTSSARVSRRPGCRRDAVAPVREKPGRRDAFPRVAGHGESPSAGHGPRAPRPATTLMRGGS